MAGDKTQEGSLKVVVNVLGGQGVVIDGLWIFRGSLMGLESI